MKSEPHRTGSVNCVYALLDPRKPRQRYSKWIFDGEPFYVGRTSNLSNRLYQHFCKHASKNSFKQAVLSRIHLSGLKPRLRVLRKGLTLIQANRYEAEVIRLVGRRCSNEGPLTNLTDGGDGATGHRHTRRTKKHLKEVNAQKWLPSHLIAIQVWSGVFDYTRGYEGRHVNCVYTCAIHGEVTQIASEASKAVRKGRTPCPECGKILRRVNVGRGVRGEEMLRTTPQSHVKVIRQLMKAQ